MESPDFSNLQQQMDVERLQLDTPRTRPSLSIKMVLAASQSLLVHGVVVAIVLLWLTDSLSTPDVAHSSSGFPSFNIDLQPTTASQPTSAVKSSNQFAEEKNEIVESFDIGESVESESPKKPAELDNPTEEKVRDEELVVTETVPPQHREQSTNNSNLINDAAVSESPQVSQTVNTNAENKREAKNLTTATRSSHSLSKEIQLPKVLREHLQEKIIHWQEGLSDFDNRSNTVSWEFQGQRLQAQLADKIASSDNVFPQQNIDISLQVGGEDVSARVAMTQLQFSHYAQFVDRWNPEVSVSNDEIAGRFHVNSRFEVDPLREGDPTFSGRVTSGARIRLPKGLDEQTLFPFGHQSLVERIPVPKILPVSNVLENVATENIYYLEEDTYFQFNENGQVAWKESETGISQVVQADDDNWVFFICESRCDYFIRGTVNGRLLLYTGGRILIEDDVQYAYKSRNNFEPNDYLALVAEKSVEVAPPDFTGPGDLQIHAAIYAKRRFAVQRFRRKNNGVMTIFGSVASGSLSATEPRYETRVLYDKRFDDVRLPLIPFTNKYQFQGLFAEYK